MGEIGNDKQVCKDFTFINQLGDELILARKNFPGTKHLIMALVEEVGELSQAMLHYKYENGSYENIYKEAVQVACVAMRIATEDDEDFRKTSKA